jgi:trehalose 2-sulfotransferase
MAESSAPRLAYLVCATHRSGSNLLCQSLWHTERAGFPQEAFSPKWATRAADEHQLGVAPEQSFYGYVRRLMEVRQTENGVFGAKIMWKHLAHFRTEIERDASWPGKPGLSDADLLRSVFPQLRCIWMRRRDAVRQAISLVKAKQTNIYNSMQLAHRESPDPSTLAFDFAAIDKEVRRFRKEDESWGKMLKASGLPIYEVIYEEFPQNFDRTVRDLLRFLGETVPDDYAAKKAAYERQSDSVNDEWYDRYVAEAK